MSSLTFRWALADTVVGCADISQSCFFGVVMFDLGETRHIRASFDGVEVEECFEFLTRGQEPVGDWGGVFLHHPGVSPSFFSPDTVILSPDGGRGFP